MLEEVVKDRMGFESLDHFYIELENSLNVPREKVNFVEEIKWFVLNDNKPVLCLFEEVKVLGKDSKLNTEQINSSKGNKPSIAIAYLTKSRKHENKNRGTTKPINSTAISDDEKEVYEIGHMIGKGILDYIENYQESKKNNLFYETPTANRNVGKKMDMLPQRILESIIEIALGENKQQEKKKINKLYKLLGDTNNSNGNRYELASDEELVIRAQLIYLDTEKEIASGINFQIASSDKEFQWNVLIPNI